MIYLPLEDSYLLSETLKEYLTKAKNKIKNKSLKILDMGSGSGIQAQTCKGLGFKNILCADVDKEVIEHLKSENLNTIQSNLFSNIKKSEKFDLIIFNPPYLPEDKREPQDSRNATTGGKKGYEIIIKFLNQAKSHLNKDAKILLLFSSFSQPKIILKKAKDLGYNFKALSSKKLFFEELFVYKLSF